MSSTLFFVRDVDAAIGFYVDSLGSTLDMRHEEDGRALVAGVSRGESCVLLLTRQWPDKVGKGVLYLALDANEFALWRAELDARRVATQEGWWGRELLIVEKAAAISYTSRIRTHD